MAELADATDLKSVGWKIVRVQVPLSPNFYSLNQLVLINLLDLLIVLPPIT